MRRFPTSYQELPTFLQRFLLQARLPLGIPTASPLAADGLAISSIPFSPDCKLIASGSIDGIVRVWNTETNESWELTGHTARVTAVSFSHDGKRIVSGSDMIVHIWYAELGVCRQLTGHTRLIRSAAFSRDDSRVASGTADGTLRIWDIKTGMLQELKAHLDSVAAVAFSPDGKHVASGSYDATVCIWDPSSNVSRLFPGHRSRVHCTA
jgi:WD40 repeat protein